MNGLDTNILIRYLTQDDPIQSPKATEIIGRRFTREHTGFISLVTMAETVWVLDAVYQIGRDAGIKHAPVCIGKNVHIKCHPPVLNGPG